MDGVSLLIVIGLTYWLTARYYKKKFGIKLVLVGTEEDDAPTKKEEYLATETYNRFRNKGKVEFRDE